jgi:hypothetical protein
MAMADFIVLPFAGDRSPLAFATTGDDTVGRVICQFSS